MAELEQMLGGLLRPGGVHRRDARDPFGRRVARVDDDERVALPLQHPKLVLRLLRQHEDRPVGGPVHQPLEQRDLTVVLVQRRAEHDAHVGSRTAPPRRRSASGRSRGRPPAAGSARSCPARPLDSPRAPRLVLKPCSRTTWSTVSRVSGATSGRSFRTRDTVAIDTPARSAMSRIVARPRNFGSVVGTGSAIGRPYVLPHASSCKRYRQKYRPNFGCVELRT